MGISTILHWHNAPVSNPNGLQLIQQRITDQYGHHQSQSAWTVHLRTHRPGSTASAQDQQKQPEILTTLAYPKTTSRFMQNVVYSFTTYTPRNGQGLDQKFGLHNGSFDDLPVIQARYWKLERDGSYQTFLDRMRRSQSPFLLPPTVVKEGEFRNVANMTASTVKRSKAGQASSQQQHAQQPVLTPGHTLIIEGVQIELNLNPGSGSGGISGDAEWIIRMGWIGGAPNPLNIGNQPLATKGIIVEVEYVPLKAMPREPNTQNQLDIPVLLSTFLSSLLPLQTVTPAPQVTVLTAAQQEWVAIGVDDMTSQCVDIRRSKEKEANKTAEAMGEPGMKWEREERVRRVSWMLVKHLKNAGLIA